MEWRRCSTSRAGAGFSLDRDRWILEDLAGGAIPEIAMISTAIPWRSQGLEAAADALGRARVAAA